MKSEACNQKLYILSSQLAELTKINNVEYTIRIYYNVYNETIYKCYNIVSEF